MTQATKKLLDEFDTLPDQDRAAFVAELLRRTAFAPHDLPEDADLVASADHLFVESIASSSSNESPQRGEVWLVALGMAAKVRPAVVVSVPFPRAGVFDAQNLVTIPHANWFARGGDSRAYNLGRSSGSYAPGSASPPRDPRSNRALEPTARE